MKKIILFAGVFCFGTFCLNATTYSCDTGSQPPNGQVTAIIQTIDDGSYQPGQAYYQYTYVTGSGTSVTTSWMMLSSPSQNIDITGIGIDLTDVRVQRFDDMGGGGPIGPVYDLL